jgi:2-keto-4-pentenoate hydratase
MNAATQSRLANRLIDARSSGHKLAQVENAERPSSLQNAYEIAAQVSDTLGEQAGWKIGATSAAGQAALGLSEPFFGRIAKAFVLPSGSLWHSGSEPLTLDGEIVFELGSVPMGADLAELQRCVASIWIGLEVNDPSYRDPMAAGGLSIIADNGAHTGLILGRNRIDPSDTDLTNLGVKLVCDGKVAATGTGANVLGDPWAALAWLVATLPKYGRSLLVGDYIASGAVCSINAIAPNEVRAHVPGVDAVVVALG